MSVSECGGVKAVTYINVFFCTDLVFSVLINQSNQLSALRLIGNGLVS